MSSSEASLLVNAAASGDEHAWSALVDQYSALVWTVARSFGLDEATSADVAQETWYRLATHLDQIREPERLAAWLTSTAKHEALRVIRVSDRVRPTEFEDERILGIDEPADDGLLGDERDRALYAALNQLSPRCQQLLRLLLAEPKIPYEEIAEMVDMPIGSIGPTRARCLDKLRDLLEGKGPLQ